MVDLEGSETLGPYSEGPVVAWCTSSTSSMQGRGSL